jgi:hypothetical protein
MALQRESHHERDACLERERAEQLPPEVTGIEGDMGVIVSKWESYGDRGITAPIALQ